MRKQVISFTIEPELEQYLRRMAEKAHCSISQYLRDLLWSGYEVERHQDDEVEVPEGVQVLKDGRWKF